ncbi:MAG: hypothetical protein ACOCTT_03475 [archaeon]
MGAGTAAAIIVLLLVIGLIWGLIGASEAQDVGVTCDMGIGDSLCFKWHKNTAGQVGEAVEDAGESIGSIFG